MPRERSPNRNKSRELWEASGRKRTIKDIAEELGVPADQVRRWKKADKWEATKCHAPPKEKKPRGGQCGNLNAKGHGAPKGNKNSFKHGIYERIMHNTLTPEEKELADVIEMDKYGLLMQSIKLLVIQEKRMMDRIEQAQKAVISGSVSSNPGMIAIGASGEQTKTEYEEDGKSNTTTSSKITQENALLFITQLDEALVRVQQRKLVAINSLHKYLLDDERFAMEKRMHGQEEEDPNDVQADPFIAALDESIGVWNEGEE